MFLVIVVYLLVVVQLVADYTIGIVGISSFLFVVGIDVVDDNSERSSDKM